MQKIASQKHAVTQFVKPVSWNIVFFCKFKLKYFADFQGLFTSLLSGRSLNFESKADSFIWERTFWFCVGFWGILEGFCIWRFKNLDINFNPSSFVNIIFKNFFIQVLNRTPKLSQLKVFYFISCLLLFRFINPTSRWQRPLLLIMRLGDVSFSTFLKIEKLLNYLMKKWKVSIINNLVITIRYTFVGYFWSIERTFWFIDINVGIFNWI